MFYRFSLELAIPEGVYDAIPTAEKLAFRDMVRELKAKAVNINEGLANEEMTTRAKWHKCFHDNLNDPRFQPCDQTEQEI